MRCVIGTLPLAIQTNALKIDFMHERLASRQTLYPTKLGAHSWRLHYLAPIYAAILISDSTKVLEHLEQHKRESPTRCPLFLQTHSEGENRSADDGHQQLGSDKLQVFYIHYTRTIYRILCRNHSSVPTGTH